MTFLNKAIFAFQLLYKVIMFGATSGSRDLEVFTGGTAVVKGCPLLNEIWFPNTINVPIPMEAIQECPSLTKISLQSNFNVNANFGNCTSLTRESVIQMFRNLKDIKSIANEVVLKNGFSNITSDMIYESIFSITNKIKDNTQADNYQHAVHEAGHALVASSSSFFKIGRLTINNNGGYLSVVDSDRNFWTHEKMMDDIQIACAGLIAEKVVFRTGGDGCDQDMQRVYKTAARAINRVGYISCSKTLPEVEPYKYIRNETEERRSRNEKEIEKLIKKCERKVTRFLKKNKRALITLANELFQRKNLKSFEVAHIIACNVRGGKYENC